MSSPSLGPRSALPTRWLTWWRVPRPVVALTAGLLLGLCWQPYGLWPLLLVALPLLTLAVRGTRPRHAFGLGYLFGLAMLTLAVGWVHVLGWWIVALLVAVESLFFAVLGSALALVSRLRWWVVPAAACWVGVELAYSRVPFGGFGWTRIAYAAVDTPLAGFFPILGVAGVSFVVALLGQLVAWGVLAVHARADRRPWRRLLPGLAAAAALVLLGAGLRGYEVEPLAGRDGTVNVGVVQGNVPGRGIEALGRARSVTDNHLLETVDLMARARLGQLPRPDFLLWPENSTDIDPLLDPITRLTVTGAVAVAAVPILVGAVTQGPGPDERQTTAMWWDPQRGVLATYHKQNLVPFGEWIPFRAQLLPLVPILKEVGAQSVPGTEPGILDVTVNGRPLKIGDVICFELAYDATVHAAVSGGAQVLMVQSNNATYGGTGQIEQQFAITRARAMEARREIAVATTNSVSGLIDRDGRVLHRTREFTAAGFVATMPLRSALTPALRMGPWLEAALAWLGLGCCLAGAVTGRRAGDGRPRSSRSLGENGSSRPGGSLEPRTPPALAPTSSAEAPIEERVP